MRARGARVAQARRADTTVVELLKEINTGNAAMKGATENAGTGNVAVIKTVVDSLNLVVAEMKALRRCSTFAHAREHARPCALHCGQHCPC